MFWVVLGALPVSAQNVPAPGDTASFEARFHETDGACGFENYTDTYQARLGEDDQGRYIDILQNSTGDAGRLRLNETGDPFIEPKNTEEDWTVAYIGDVLAGEYTYDSVGCVQLWQAELFLPPGYFQFLVDGQAAPPTEETAPPTEQTSPPSTEESTALTETVVPPTEATAQPVTEGSTDAGADTTGDSGIDFLLLILIAILVLLFGWGFYWYLVQRPKRLYRFDRGDAGEFIDDDDDIEIVDGLDLPTFGDFEEAEEVFLPPRGEDIPDEEPPDHRLCDKFHEHWRESVDRLTRLEQEADDRVGTDDPIADIHSRMLDEARASMEAYRRTYDECLEAHPEEAPATPDQLGGEQAQPTDEPGDGSEPGDDPDSGLPGVIVPPHQPPVDPAPKPDCVDGSSKIVVESEKTFRVAGGNITILGAGANSRFGGNGISGADLSNLDSSELEDVFLGIEAMGAENKVTVTIPTKLLTIKCIRVMHCVSGEWVETDRSRVEESTAGPPVSARWRSQERRGSGRQVTKNVIPIIQQLDAAQKAADAYRCD